MTENFICCSSAQGGRWKEKRKYFNNHVTTDSKYSQLDDLAVGFLHKLPICGMMKQNLWVSLEENRSALHIILQQWIMNIRIYSDIIQEGNFQQLQPRYNGYKTSIVLYLRQGGPDEMGLLWAEERFRGSKWNSPYFLWKLYILLESINPQK